MLPYEVVPGPVPDGRVGRGERPELRGHVVRRAVRVGEPGPVDLVDTVQHTVILAAGSDSPAACCPPAQTVPARPVPPDQCRPERPANVATHPARPAHYRVATGSGQSAGGRQVTPSQELGGTEPGDVHHPGGGLLRVGLRVVGQPVGQRLARADQGVRDDLQVGPGDLPALGRAARGRASRRPPRPAGPASRPVRRRTAARPGPAGRAPPSRRGAPRRSRRRPAARARAARRRAGRGRRPRRWPPSSGCASRCRQATKSSSLVPRYA